MKALLLAAGLGTRLQHITVTTPKCLLPVGGRPLLSWWVEWLSSWGVKEVLINTHHLAEQVGAWVAQRHPCRIILSHETELPGSGGTLRVNRAFVQDEELFLVIYADMWVETDLASFLAYGRSHDGLLTVAVYETDCPQEAGIFVFDQQGIVTDFEEKPRRPKSSWSNTGILLARPAILDYIPNQPFADLSRDVLPSLVGRMRAFPLAGFFLDIGTPERYAAANVRARECTENRRW